MTTAIVETTKEGVYHVCRNMRQADREEIFATRWRDDPDDVARDSLAAPGFKWMAVRDGVPEAVVGVRPMWPGVWCAWAYGTPQFQQVSRHLTRHIQRVIMPALVLARAHRLEAHSIVTHVEAHQWLEYLGAARERTIREFGKGGEDFIVFAWTRESLDVHDGRWGRRWRRWRGGGSRAPA